MVAGGTRCPNALLDHPYPQSATRVPLECAAHLVPKRFGSVGSASDSGSYKFRVRFRDAGIFCPDDILRRARFMTMLGISGVELLDPTQSAAFDWGERPP